MGLSDVQKQVPLIIKSKERQKIEKTKQNLNNKVDPVNLNTTNIENRKNGTVIIQSKTDEDRNKIKNVIESKVDRTYDVKAPNEGVMSIIITDMSFKYNDEELI